MENASAGLSVEVFWPRELHTAGADNMDQVAAAPGK
jgi:hypothetical protein